MRIYVLGAGDPEMDAIARLLQNTGAAWLYATKDGDRCQPGTAYKADSIYWIEFLGFTEFVLIECEPGGLDPQRHRIIRIDHHRKGDVGYALGPAEYWEASSLGQLYGLLGITDIPQEARVLAAMDHCPAAAFSDRCPGVTAEEVYRMKVREISKSTRTDPRQVQRLISKTSALLRTAPVVIIGGQKVRDLRSEELGEGYSLEFLTAQVAAMSGGLAALLRTKDLHDPRAKWLLSGNVSPACAKAFMDEWAPAHGLEGIYGVPERGYAGGYLPLP